MTKKPQLIVEHNLPVPMRDGVVLRADVYRPSEGQHPVLLSRTPYSKDMPMGLMVVLNPVRAAQAGYAVVVQDVRGRFESEGDFTPFVNEAIDGYDTVEWAASQAWSTGRVGMYGSSYLAATQLQAATEAPPHLCAIAPMEGTAEYFEGRSYLGGALELGAMLSIALYALGPGSIQRSVKGEEFRKIWRQIRGMIDALPDTARTAPLSDLRTTVIGEWMPYFFQWMEHDEQGPFWESMSIAAKHDRIRVPALHVSSWYDNFVNGAIQNYAGIREHGATEEARAHQYLWLGPWGHYMPRTAMNGAARLGEMEFGLNALVDLDVVQLAWFDRWLKNDTASWRFDSPVRLFVLGENRWRNVEEWPIPAAKTQLYFDGGGRLAPAPATDDSPDHYRSDPENPVPTVGGAHLIFESTYPQGPWDQRDVESRDDVILYTTDAMTADMTVIGDISCDVWVSSSVPSTDIVATLTVVHEDGRSINLREGIRRVDLTIGEPTKVRVELGPIAYRFGAGERIRLRIAGSNFPRFDLNPQTGERPWMAAKRVAADQLLFHDEARQSLLTLPVVGGSLDA